MAYTVDLIFILQGLFDYTLVPRYKGRPSWKAICDAIDGYRHDLLAPLGAVHDDICSEVKAWSSTLDREAMCLSMKKLIHARLHNSVDNRM
jgi:hypothetical protein